MIKNIIFDLGNVLLTFYPAKYLAEQGYTEEQTQLLLTKIFRSKEWVQLDRGTITVEEVKALHAGEDAKLIHKCLDSFGDMFNPIEENVAILGKLKEKGYNCYILSNFHTGAHAYVANKYPFFEQFDGGIISAHVKLLKPEKEIYDEVLGKHNLVAEESLFIDDTLENIEAAKALGIHGIHLHDPSTLQDELAKLDIIL